MTALLVVWFTAFISPEPGLNLEIVVHEVDPAGGTMRVALYRSSGDFLGTNGIAYYAIEEACAGDFCRIKLNVIPGRYAVSVYQDLNDDTRLNKNFLGIPVEPYGFSNDAMGLMGPPSFEASAVEMAADTTIEIHLR